jgi:Cu/Ag efflux protein CusF
MYLQRTILAAGLVIGLSAMVLAQQTVIRRGDMVKASATIEQIDKANRMITFKNDDGTEDTVSAGPEFKRFDELKVGDKVNMTYYESTVIQVRKPGEPPLQAKSGSGMTGTSGALPGGTISRQTVKTVTVKQVDPDAGSITVVTADGRTLTRKVRDRSALKGVTVGDHIDIAYTEAVLASVERK